MEHDEEEDHGKAYGLTMVEEDTTWELKEEPKIVLEVKDLLKGRGNVTTPSKISTKYFLLTPLTRSDRAMGHALTLSMTCLAKSKDEP